MAAVEVMPYPVRNTVLSLSGTLPHAGAKSVLLTFDAEVFRGAAEAPSSTLSDFS